MAESDTTLDPLAALPWQDTPWQGLVARREAGRFPHALLLTGPAGVGKNAFARRLAASLVCDSGKLSGRPCGQCQACHLARGGSHPDIHWLSPEEEGKQIRIDGVRKLIDRSTLTTQAAGMRVFVISPADALNRHAANALLKTLEEPVASSCLVLVSSAPHRLPQTILSRCQRVNFPPVEPEVARKWLREQGKSGDIEAALAASAGAPLAALGLLEEGGLEALQALLQSLLQLAARQAHPVTTATEWASRPVPMQLDYLRRILFDLTRLAADGSPVRQYLPGSAHGLQKLAKDINLQGMFRFMDEINRLENQLGHNLNPQMLMEKLVNDWLSLTRPEKR